MEIVHQLGLSAAKIPVVQGRTAILVPTQLMAG